MLDSASANAAVCDRLRMRNSIRSLLVVVVTLVSAVVLAVASVLASAGLSLAAETSVTALIMGGSGTPDPDKEVGYIPNV